MGSTDGVSLSGLFSSVCGVNGGHTHEYERLRPLLQMFCLQICDQFHDVLLGGMAEILLERDGENQLVKAEEGPNFRQGLCRVCATELWVREGCWEQVSPS